MSNTWNQTCPESCLSHLAALASAFAPCSHTPSLPCVNAALQRFCEDGLRCRLGWHACLVSLLVNTKLALFICF